MRPTSNSVASIDLDFLFLPFMLQKAFALPLHNTSTRLVEVNENSTILKLRTKLVIFVDL